MTQNFNAIAATILARSNRADSGSRLWITKHGIPRATYRGHSADDCIGHVGRRRIVLRSAGHSNLCFFHTLYLPSRSRCEVSAATFFIFQKSPRARSCRGVPRVCAADRARGLLVCPKPVKKYSEGDG